MHRNVVIIYDKRLEIPIKYKKNIENKILVNVICAADKKDLMLNLEETQAEMILISESVQEDFGNLCREIRQKNSKNRPVIVLLSKSSFANDKIEALQNGADDFLSEPIDLNELTARIAAHLRRKDEENSSFLTKLPTHDSTVKFLKRAMQSDDKWAVLYIDIDNINAYREIYGEIPASKLLQTYSAILNATIEAEDFVGHLKENDFIIITSSYKAEKLADYLNFTFDIIAQKFYSATDNERGYILLQGDNKAGCKIPIMTTSIGIINSELKNYIDVEDALLSVDKMQKLAKTLIGSSKIIDRPLISSEKELENIDNKTILIFEQDKDLAYLLDTTLKIQGYNPVICGFNCPVEYILSIPAKLIIIDGDDNAIELCRKIKANSLKNIKIIFTDTKHDKEKILGCGADVYLPKPYELVNLFSWIEKILG
ncbi:MAG: response regulator [Candidatus Gastranaerophilales bacterium]|nr:response regulator [Candidatus Gastranaerophilales bacterium]